MDTINNIITQCIDEYLGYDISLISELMMDW